jgi:CheY-like chemotaxis protein
MATASKSGEEGQLEAVTRILIVEDDHEVARLVERLIRRTAASALEIVRVVTGEAAIALLTTCDPFDAVVSDCHLGGGATGLDVLAVSRALPTPPPFLFLTSDERAQGLGVPCLAKPCSLNEIRAALAKLLDVDQPKVVKEMPLDGAFDVGGVA